MLTSSLHKLLAFNPFRGRTGPEDAIGLEVGSSLRAWALEGRLKATFSHLPNEIAGGGKSASIRVALAKAMGMIPGGPDYVFAWHGGSGWIELKSKAGSLSPDQKLFREWCASLGVEYAVCRSLIAVEAALVSWGQLDARKPL